jgi:hypothetical protein
VAATDKQRVRSPTRRTPATANPDPLDQQRRTQPTPIGTPANEPPLTTRTALWWNHHLLAGTYCVG